MEPTNYYSSDELRSLQEKGVRLPSIEHVLIERTVDLNQIHSGAILYPFCQIRGSQTKIHEHAQIGLNGPATLNNSVVGSHAIIGNLGPCTLVDSHVGTKSVLGSGVMEQAVSLGKESDANDFTTGLGFRMRKGSLYEEDASSAQHTDTKMTILFPWVTLGSNINFCDTLLCGGSGPELGNFSEVGSGTIHFNFTIRGDKATASLFGKVPEGLFLKEDRLFMGGNSSLIGPLSAEFGAFCAAGIRVSGNLKEGLNLGQGVPRGHVPYNPNNYNNLKSIFDSQSFFIANLIALHHWYEFVRLPLAQSLEQQALYRAGLKMVQMNITERCKQLQNFMEGAISVGIADVWKYEHQVAQQRWAQFSSTTHPIPLDLEQELDEQASRSLSYLKSIQSLSDSASALGKQWLQKIIQHYHQEFPKVP